MEIKSQLRFEIDPSDIIISPEQSIINYDVNNEGTKTLKVRLDKWLWAARFFKTRALARSAIENGCVYYEGQKTIPSKEIAVGANLVINQGKIRKIIIIRQLSTRRRSTDEANSMFEEVGRSLNPAVPHTPGESTELGMEKRPRKMVRFLRRGLSPSGEPSRE